MLQNSFLTEFLLVSDIRTVLFIAILIAIFIGMYRVQVKKIKFSTRMLLGTLIGLVLGIIIQAVAGFPLEPEKVTWLTEVSSWYGLIGNGFMDLLKMLVVPLVLLSLVRVVMNMEGENLGKLAGLTIGLLVGITLIAGALGSVLATVFNLGEGFKVVEATTNIREVTPIVETLRGLLPANIVHSMAENNIIGVVIFAAFIGSAIRRLKVKHLETIQPFIQWVEASYKIILSIAMTIIKWMPYAVVALLSNTITSRGIGVLASVFKTILVVYLALFLMLIVHMLIAYMSGITPKEYLTKGMDTLVLAFTSRSSLGTLPVLIETLDKKWQVDEGIASFVGSLGSNMGMNGCAGIYPSIVVTMLAKMVGVETGLSFYIMLAIVIAVSSFGIVGIPGSATIAVSVVISGMGMSEYFPLIGAIIAIDPILDMGRTMINVSGTMVSALTVNRILKGAPKKK